MLYWNRIHLISCWSTCLC